MWETKLAGISFLDNFVLNKNLMELSTSYCSKHSKQLFICWTTEECSTCEHFPSSINL